MRLPLALPALLLVAAACGSPDSEMAPEVAEAAAPVPGAASCEIFPADNVWNTPITDLPVHASSADWVASIGLEETAHPDFGSGLYEGAPIGIPYEVVGPDQPGVAVSFEYADESDPGPYPIPDNPAIEGGPDGDGDRHILIVESGSCTLYELYAAYPNPDGSWTAGSGAIYDLGSNELRPETWTSADAAGLPILPGLVRYDEVAAGVIDHAIRITAPETDRSYIWPARHQAGAAEDPSLPPMGARFRLRDTVNPADFPEQVQPIIVALQTYGAILADNGSPWYISGVPDGAFDNDALRTLMNLTGADWEAVDTSSMIIDANSGAAAGGPAGPTPEPAGPLREGGRVAGSSRIGTAVAISQRQFPDGADTVYLARADTFVDAVAGGVLTDGPILLVPQCGELPTEVAVEIARLDPTRVLALGGDAAVCEDILTQARAA